MKPLPDARFEIGDPRLAGFPAFEPGTVWLAGAGPGDPGLLTLLALHALRQADVVVHDALVSDAVLALIPPGTARESAGKRGGTPSPRQTEISQRLIALAREGRRVLRLKGGDPMMFGRGADEALALAHAGIAFRFIPGISAGSAAAAYAGIPLTHGDDHSAVTFLTGHSTAGKVPDGLDWQAIAKGAPVLVIYMGLRNLAEIAARLAAAGRRADEPVAIIANATLPDQRVLESTLGRCADDAARAGLESPAMVIIGDAVALRPALDWRRAAANAPS